MLLMRDQTAKGADEDFACLAITGRELSKMAITNYPHGSFLNLLGKIVSEGIGEFKRFFVQWTDEVIVLRGKDQIETSVAETVSTVDKNLRSVTLIEKVLAFTAFRFVWFVLDSYLNHNNYIELLKKINKTTLIAAFGNAHGDRGWPMQSMF